MGGPPNHSDGPIHGDTARQSLAAISESALTTDAELANAVGSFWPTDIQKKLDQINRTKALIDVYQRRQQEASPAGADDPRAQAYAASVSELQDQLTKLQADLAGTKPAAPAPAARNRLDGNRGINSHPGF